MNRLMLATILIVACGTQENSNLLDQKIKPPSNQTNATESEGLGLRSEDGGYRYRHIQGPRIDSEKAFSSFRKFSTFDTKRCSGVLAYDSTSAGVQVYLYTARHCFEKRNPFGRQLAVPPSGVKRVTKFTTECAATTKPGSLATPDPCLPFEGSSRERDEPLSMDKPENLKLEATAAGGTKIERDSDIIRLPQPQLNPLYTSFLRVCSDPAEDAYSDFQAVGTRQAALAWANFQRDTIYGSLPASVRTLLRLSNSNFPLNIAGRVKANANDSGAPVFAVSMDTAKKQLIKHECLYGIITREVWLREKCTAGECGTFRGNALFQRLAHKTGYWEAANFPE